MTKINGLTKLISFRVEEPLYRMIEKISIEEDLPFSEVVRRIVEESFDYRKPQN